jgi:hypothetical protein
MSTGFTKQSRNELNMILDAGLASDEMDTVWTNTLNPELWTCSSQSCVLENGTTL